MNERLRKSILKILKEHNNDNLASEASREMITEEILRLFPQVTTIDVSKMTYPEAMKILNHNERLWAELMKRQLFHK